MFPVYECDKGDDSFAQSGLLITLDFVAIQYLLTLVIVNLEFGFACKFLFGNSDAFICH